MKKDLYDVAVEISSVSAMLEGLSFQLEEGATRLNDENFALALHGVSNYLERIAESIDEIDEKFVLTDRQNITCIN